VFDLGDGYEPLSLLGARALDHRHGALDGATVATARAAVDDGHALPWRRHDSGGLMFACGAVASYALQRGWRHGRGPLHLYEFAAALLERTAIASRANDDARARAATAWLRWLSH
jgi:hypothetical protein